MMNSKTAFEIVDGADVILSDQDAWTTHGYFRADDGWVDLPDKACSFCLSGALIGAGWKGDFQATLEDKNVKQALNAVGYAIDEHTGEFTDTHGEMRIISWNDSSATFQDVKDVLSIAKYKLIDASAVTV